MPTEATVRTFRPLAALVPAHWQTGETAAADGTRLFFHRTPPTGKPPLLLLHGVQVGGLTWLRTAAALETDYDVIMPDARGHGQSGRLTDNHSPDLFVSDAITILQHLGLDQPFVIGHSMGADIAGRLAAQHPVRAVVLVDPALANIMAGMPPLDPHNPPPFVRALLATFDAIRTQPHPDNLVAGLQLLPPGRDVTDERDFVSLVETQGQFDTRLFFSTTPDYLFQQPDTIAAIRAPVLLLTAAPMLPGVDTTPGLNAFTANWQSGQHIHFPNAGHFIMADQFDRFIQVVRGFLATH